MIGKCPGSDFFKKPKPEEIKCPLCGSILEIWSDEQKVLCNKCKIYIPLGIKQNCLDWCKQSKECIGEEAYNKYTADKTKQKDCRIENLERFMRTPKDISDMPLEEKANILALHFIGYLAKPNGINDEIYSKCIEAFNNNRGKVEWESEAILSVLKKYHAS